MVEWAKGEALRFLKTFIAKMSGTLGITHKMGEVALGITLFVTDSLGIIVFLGSVQVLHEHLVKGSGSPTWSAYTDHNPIEVRLAKGWVFRQPPEMKAKQRRPYWASLRGIGEGPKMEKEALAPELGRRMRVEQPQSCSDDAGLVLSEVASAVLGPEPPRDSRPWVVGLETELRHFDDAVAQASSRKRSAVDDDEWRSAQKAWDRPNTGGQHGYGQGGCMVGGPDEQDPRGC